MLEHAIQHAAEASAGEAGVNWLWWIPALPLAGSAVCGILHFAGLRGRPRAAHADHRESHEHSDTEGAHDTHAHQPAQGAPAPAPFASAVAVLAMAVAFALAVTGFLSLTNLTPHARVLESAPWHWIDTGEFMIDIALVLDPLSAVMTLIITGVGLLIHIYAAGYMKGDPGYAKFFAYLNLFVFAMLMLVLSSSLLGLFIGWEGVGLCSYLLIGFWYEKGWPAEAGQKAFVMNRIGDACFLIGSFLLVRSFGTLDLSSIAAAVPGALHANLASPDLVWAAVFLFAGACGKSAQLPLFTWLPDAMAGPTPVSALIHAATMVTAGIYLVVRMGPLFAASPSVLLLIGTIGAITALIAGSTALAQRDIKKVLAYSTVSQLGYMFLGLGSGAFAAAIFHLATHAFFKALLFLGAGSVIHGMHEEQDMHKMGGLAKHMPRTFLTFLAGAAALSGLPLMSGYFSKDEILAHTYAHGGVYSALWILGLLTAAMTAFYTWRMVALTFAGKERFDVHKVHPHESPAVMTTPLMILAVLSVFGGLLGLPVVFHAPHLLAEWLEPVTGPAEALLAEHPLSHGTEIGLLLLGAIVAVVFALTGWNSYRAGIATDEKIAAKQPALARFLGDAWGIDRAYERLVVQPLKLFAFGLAVIIDQFAIDGLVNGAASLTRGVGERVRRMASGSITSYSLWMGAATALLVIVVLWQIGA